MKTTGRAELGGKGSQGRTQPDTQVPWPASVTAQNAPALLPATGAEASSATKSVGNVL